MTKFLHEILFYQDFEGVDEGILIQGRPQLEDKIYIECPYGPLLNIYLCTIIVLRQGLLNNHELHCKEREVKVNCKFKPTHRVTMDLQWRFW